MSHTAIAYIFPCRGQCRLRLWEAKDCFEISAATYLIWLCSWWRSSICNNLGKWLCSIFRSCGWGGGLRACMLLGRALNGRLCICCSSRCRCASRRDRRPGQSRAESVLCDQRKPARSAHPTKGQGEGVHGQESYWQSSRGLGGVRWCSRLARCRWCLDSRLSRLVGRGGLGLALRSLAASRGSSSRRTRRLVALEGLHPPRHHRPAHKTTSPQK